MPRPTHRTPPRAIPAECSACVTEREGLPTEEQHICEELYYEQRSWCVIAHTMRAGGLAEPVGTATRIDYPQPRAPLTHTPRASSPTQRASPVAHTLRVASSSARASARFRARQRALLPPPRASPPLPHRFAG